MLSTSDYTLTLSRETIIDHVRGLHFYAIAVWGCANSKEKTPAVLRNFQFSFFLLFNYEHARMPPAKQPVGFNPNLFSFRWRARRADFARQRRVHSNTLLPNQRWNVTKLIHARIFFVVVHVDVCKAWTLTRWYAKRDRSVGSSFSRRVCFLETR